MSIRHCQFGELVVRVELAGNARRKEAEPSRVRVSEPADIKAVRLQLGQTQLEFARLIGVSVPTLRDWEHGRRNCQVV